MPQRTRAEDLLVTLMETAEDALLTLAMDGTVEGWSRGAEHLFGYSAGEMVGRDLEGLLQTENAAASETLLGSTTQGETDYSKTIERLHMNGSRIHVIVKRAAIRGPDGKITGILERGRGLNRSAALNASDTPGEAQLRMLIEQLLELGIGFSGTEDWPGSACRKDDIRMHEVPGFQSNADRTAP